MTEAVSRSFPVLRLQPQWRYFSPNGDGFLDFVKVAVAYKSGRNIAVKDWQLRIYGPIDVVKTVLPERRRRKPSFFSSSAEVEIPKAFYWDGKDQSGRIQPDGRYRFELQIVYDYNNIERYSIADVFIETSLPDVVLSPVRLYLLRHQVEGKPDRLDGEIVIEQKLNNPKDSVLFQATILDARNQVIETRQWKDRLPNRITWNGRKQNGEPAPVGVYRYELRWNDTAGNRKWTAVNQLLVLSASKPPSVILYTDAFFVNKNAVSLEPRQTADFTGHLAAQSLKVGLAGSRQISQVELSMASDTMFGKDTPFIKVAAFNRSSAANLVDTTLFRAATKEGLYRLNVADGEAASTSPVYFMLDKTPPSLSVRVSTGQVLPGDFVTVKLGYKDQSPLFGFELRLLLKTDSSWSLLRRWRGSSLPDTIEWDGRTNVEHSVIAGETLVFEFEAVDLVGHRSVVRSALIRSGVKFESIPSKRTDQSQYNLQSLLALDENFSETGILANGRSLVSQVCNEWKQLEGYRIRIRSFVSFQGEEEENLKRSELIAQKIRDAVVSGCAPPKLVSYRGDGEVNLLSESDDEFSKYRNDRILIEFLQGDDL